MKSVFASYVLIVELLDCIVYEQFNNSSSMLSSIWTIGILFKKIKNIQYDVFMLRIAYRLQELLKTAEQL